MTHSRVMLRWLTGAAVAALVVVTPVFVAAQRPVGPDGTPSRRGFGRPGAKDFAVSELKSVGFFNRTCMENAGIATFNCAPFFQVMKNGLVAINPEGSGLEFDWGVPPTTWNYAKALVPSLANAVGGGWAAISIQQTSNDDMDAADGSLGTHHAGVTSVNDNSCRDHGNAFGAGNPLLAGSDCEDTWGSEGWKGARPVPQDVYLAHFLADPSNFQFNFWEVGDAELTAAGVTPPSEHSPGKTIGSFQSYGFESDHTSEILCGTTVFRSYGSVIPTNSPTVPGGCSGSPTRPGWPLGIDLRIDAFTFQLPALKEISYYQATFTNNSRKLYGVPLDYDSLYINLNNGWYGGDQRQQQINYHDPSRGLWVIQTGPLKPCAVAREIVDLTCAAGAWGAVGVTLGFNYGAAAMIVLKSPIGDLRNKLFSRPSSPFYNLSNIHAGDTLTFNHAHLCGFRACARNTYATTPSATPDHEQRAFGMMSSTELNVLGSRAASALTQQVYWHTFRNYAFDNVRYAAGQAAAVGGGFNKYVPPGGWDYNHDGTLDTLHLDGCFINGCSAVWGDTLPNGKYAAYSNVGSTLAAGPITLKADSVTSYVFAITTAQSNDSAGFEAQVASAIDNYMNFYLAPEAAPKCRVVGSTRPSAAEGSGISFTWDNSCFAGQWTDKFIAKQYADLVAADTGTALGRIRRLNPWLVDTLLFLSTNNLEKLYVFKTCNDGGVWTTANDCVTGSPATGAPFDQLGYLPLATYATDGGSGIPNSFLDANVLPGLTYTYNLVGETRGAVFDIVNGDAVTTIIGIDSTIASIDSTVVPYDTTWTVFPVTTPDTVCASNCRHETLSLAPKLFNALSASTGEVNVARVYLPLSLQAGGSRSRAVAVDSTGPMSPARVGVTVTADSLAAGDYKVTFGDSVRATITRRYDRDSTYLRGLITQVVLYQGAGSTTINGTNSGAFTPSGAVVGAASFVLDTAGAPDDSLVTTPYTWSTGPVMALARRVGAADVDALLVTNTLAGASATPGAFHANPDYPKFDLGVDNSLSDKFNTQGFFAASGSPVPPLAWPTVAWQPALAVQNQTTSQGQASGRYVITWGAKTFGDAEPFRLNFSNPSASAAAIVASLTARAPVSTGVKTDSAAAAVQAALGGTVTIDSLVAVKLPFTVTNLSYGRPVLVAMRRRPNKSIVVGFGADTIRVAVPDDVWVPSDTLVFVERLGNGTGAQAATFQRAVIGCDPVKYTRLSCNPVYPNTRGSPAGTSYLGAVSGQLNGFEYYTRITSASTVTLRASSPVRGAALVSQSGAIRSGLAAVRVVPNPFIMLSQYGPNNDRGQWLLFTHMPPRGVLRIYTVAGQFVQQISWTEADLKGDGDLGYNLRTREGNFLGAGLYIYVLSATDASGATIASRTDKFVVIR